MFLGLAAKNVYGIIRSWYYIVKQPSNYYYGKSCTGDKHSSRQNVIRPHVLDINYADLPITHQSAASASKGQNKWEIKSKGGF